MSLRMRVDPFDSWWRHLRQPASSYEVDDVNSLS